MSTIDLRLFENQIMWMNSKEAAKYLRISTNNLRVKIHRGDIIPDGKLGRTLRFRRDRLDHFLESSLTGGTK